MKKCQKAFSEALVLGFFFLLPSINLKAAEWEIMHYNVENLFDTIHDDGKNDWTFLPKQYPGKQQACQKAGASYRVKECSNTDWNAEKLQIKLEQIKKVILGENNSLPTFLAVSEIENEKVAKMLADKLSYQNFAITNSPDERGIDVALFYNTDKDLRFIGKFEHVLAGDTFKKDPTRNILEVQFKIKDQILSIFVAHWPSQAAPTAVRTDVASQLRNLAQERMNETNHHVIMLGDFNTIASENPNPIDSALLGNNSKLLDAYAQLMQSSEVSESNKDQMPKGSYYFAKNHEWNLLDRIIFDGGMLNNQTLHVEIPSYQIYNPAFMSRTFSDGQNSFRVPVRYNFDATNANAAGFSDHFPIRIKISTDN